MNTHHIDLAGYYPRPRGNNILYLGTAGSHGNEQLQVTLGEGWEDLTVQVIFHPSKVAVQLPEDGLLDVPWEATVKPLTAIQGRIVFQGFNQERLVNTIDLAYTVARHSSTEGRDEEPYTPGIVEEVLNQMAADKEEMLSAAQQADQAKKVIQEAVKKIENAEANALENIAAAAPALPAVSEDNAGQVVTVKSDGTGYHLTGPYTFQDFSIRLTTNGNPAVCIDGAACGFPGLKVYGKSMQSGMPSLENPVPIVSAGESGSVKLNMTGANLFDISQYPFPLTSQGLIFSKNTDGSFTIRGTSTTMYNCIAQNTILQPGTYYISGGKSMSSGVARVVADGVIYFNQAFKLEKQLNVQLQIQVDGMDPINSTIYPMLKVGNTVAPYEPYKSNIFVIDTPNGLLGVPVEGEGNYTDKTGKMYVSDCLDFEAGVQNIYCGRIDSYNGEEITTPYISSTGALTIGAQVIYILPKPQIQPIPDVMMAAYHALTAYEGTTVVSTAEPVAGIEVCYVIDGAKYAEKINTMEARLTALELAGK